MNDKITWVKTRLGDVIDNIIVYNTRFPDENFERIVGLDNMESGSFHIPVVMVQNPATSFTKVFRTGQTLFGKRRAYQKKIAIAECDGLCSGDILVLDSKDENRLLSLLIPFICASNSFYNFVIGNSQGSLSPRISFKALQNFEFLLPPIEEQKKIAEVLWAADEALATYRTMRVRTQQLQQAFINKWVDAHSTKFYKFYDIWKQSPESGCSASEVARETGHYVLSLSAISENGYKPGERKCVERTSKMEKAILYKGDLLISRSNTMELVGLSAIYSEDTNNVSFPDTMMRISINESEAIKEYIATLFNAAYGRQWMRKICAGTSHSMKKINRKSLGEVPIPLVEKIQQINFLNKCKNLNDTIEMCTKKINNLQSMLFALIDHYLGGAK